MGDQPELPESRIQSNDWKKWLVATAICVVMLLVGYIGGSAHQVFGTFRNPDTCTSKTIVVVTSDCIAHRNLMAAEASANATRIYMWLTLAGLVVSLLTLIGLFKTLHLNRKALNEAIRSNTVASQLGQAQVRAYIVIQSLEARLGNDGRVSLQPTFFNSGQSPARKLKWTMRAGVDWPDAYNELQTSLTQTDTNMDESVWLNEVASHTTLRPSMRTLPLEWLPDHIPNSGRPCPMAAEIIVEYEDVFSAKHQIRSSFSGSLTIRDPNNSNLAEVFRVADDYFQQKFMN